MALHYVDRILDDGSVVARNGRHRPQLIEVSPALGQAYYEAALGTPKRPRRCSVIPEARVVELPRVERS